MKDSEEDICAIPAASIADVDIAAIAEHSERTAREISRLGQLMDQGKETEEEFAQLIKLLFETGAKVEAEYLLRRNLEVGDASHSLYLELFGTVKVQEFRDAILAFRTEFETGLTLVEELAFLDETYLLTSKQSNCSLPSGPCEVRFDYSERDFVSADISQLDGNEYLITAWVQDINPPLI